MAPVVTSRGLCLPIVQLPAHNIISACWCCTLLHTRAHNEHQGPQYMRPWPSVELSWLGFAGPQAVVPCVAGVACGIPVFSCSSTRWCSCVTTSGCWPDISTLSSVSFSTSYLLSGTHGVVSKGPGPQHAATCRGFSVSSGLPSLYLCSAGGTAKPWICCVRVRAVVVCAGSTGQAAGPGGRSRSDRSWSSSLYFSGSRYPR